ncbi:hypothetical protein C8046_11390 [Serinibacter arcticus]|uniref:FAD-dependent urate hydroxylase HpyO/Asp monooxygenase CreE-like FAD/NAD(P)-binding domain-containing protein n=1 Tax=Serinibacter arcticus TaxID=1655435 RepID=A0A2U1ZW08_9MICO|nr:FAD/NAD(P)-binding domain-containing protein [Serinibacter arcticus]PWD51159.1 hypothetical protein C8046_11390 [Serinibacter arcticus]
MTSHPPTPQDAGGAPAGTTLAVVGTGVRGTQLLLRLGRLLADEGAPLELHVVDPFGFGAGRTWRTDQPDELLMNGPTESVSAFRLGEGPDLVTWLDDDAPGEPSRRGEFPSRNVYGRYLAWVFEQALAALPARVAVHRHRAWVRSLRPTGTGAYRLGLEGGATAEVRADVVVLALGWLEAESRDGVVGGLPHGATWIAPGHPAEQDLAAIPDGATVLARGLGMSFFDALSLLTIGRGGRFVPRADGEGEGLAYEASGREPVVHVGTRRGVPFRAKIGVAGPPPGDGGAPALPRPGPHPALEAVLGGSAAPLTATDRLLDAVLADARAAVATAGGDPDGLTFEGLEAPLAGRTWATWDDVHAATLDELERDVVETRRAATSPLKAAHRSIGESRKLIAPVLERRGIDASAWPEYQRILRLGAMLAGGPPLERAEQLLALVRAGVVRFTGPEVAVAAVAAVVEVPDGGAPGVRNPLAGGAETPRRWLAGDGGGGVLEARSAHVVAAAGAPRASVLLDAWMHAPNLATTVDPLLRSLLDGGLVRVHRVVGVAGTGDAAGASGPPSGAIDVDPRTGEVLDADGAPQPRLVALGIPTEGARAFTILSPYPGVDERAIDECERAAAHVAALLP